MTFPIGKMQYNKERFQREGSEAMIFRVTAALRSVCDITPSMLQHFGIRGLLLDLDNTLTTHDNSRPADGVKDWIAAMKENGVAMCIVSNNHPPRVKPFADLLGLPFVCEGKKPLAKGFREAKILMDLPWDALAVVGDQIFTDVLGANLKRLKCIFVFPIAHEQTRFFRFKRRMEVPFLPRQIYEEEKG